MCGLSLTTRKTQANEEKKSAQLRSHSDYFHSRNSHSLHSIMDKAVHDLYKATNDDQQKVTAPNDAGSSSVPTAPEPVGQSLVGQQATKPITQADAEANPAFHPN
jgi:hypothetical protein